MKIVKYFVLWILLTLAMAQATQLVRGFIFDAKESFNEYIDARIRVIMHVQRDYIYEDLMTLHPKRVTYHRGRYHVQ